MRAVHWFRNDLRLEDNTALLAAAGRADDIALLYVLDPHRLDASAKRANFLLESLRELQDKLEAAGVGLTVRHGDPVEEVPRLLREAQASLLTFNRDYTPYARRRDEAVTVAARALGAQVLDHKDRVVFENAELRTQAGGLYHVYTPFLRAWRTALQRQPLPPQARLKLPRAIAGLATGALPPPFADDGEPIVRGGAGVARRRLKAFLAESIADYAARREIPAVDGTSLLSPHLRFGTISVRECVRAAEAAAAADRRRAAGVQKWIAELAWRDFYAALLAEYPRILGGAFRREFADIVWNDDDAGFAAWCAGRTGYPMVDAGMRQLVHCGWMHNRARMVVASFLVKDLLLDWRRGEAFFMRHLLDGDPASNNGGWQWSASTGTDAQPYFRVFSPTAQGERFDPRGEYARRWIPELRDVPDRFVHRPWDAPVPPREYPAPIVDHAERRVMAIARFEAARA